MLYLQKKCIKSFEFTFLLLSAESRKNANSCEFAKNFQNRLVMLKSSPYGTEFYLERLGKKLL